MGIVRTVLVRRTGVLATRSYATREGENPDPVTARGLHERAWRPSPSPAAYHSPWIPPHSHSPFPCCRSDTGNAERQQSRVRRMILILTSPSRGKDPECLQQLGIIVMPLSIAFVRRTVRLKPRDGSFGAHGSVSVDKGIRLRFIDGSLRRRRDPTPSTR